jgi:hypothetical protein
MDVLNDDKMVLNSYFVAAGADSSDWMKAVIASICSCFSCPL